MISHDARELAKQFSRETSGFVLPEIEDVWSAYSASRCASWLIPNSATEVERVFDHAAVNRNWTEDEFYRLEVEA